jgi:hypothetical protein
MPLTAHAITARKAEQVSPTHRVSVEPYINIDSQFNKREFEAPRILPPTRRTLDLTSCEGHRASTNRGKWQGQQGSNLRPAVLETAALPAELYPHTLRLPGPRIVQRGAFQKHGAPFKTGRHEWQVRFSIFPNSSADRTECPSRPRHPADSLERRACRMGRYFPKKKRRCQIGTAISPTSDISIRQHAEAAVVSRGSIQT